MQNAAVTGGGSRAYSETVCLPDLRIVQGTLFIRKSFMHVRQNVAAAAIKPWLPMPISTAASAVYEKVLLPGQPEGAAACRRRCPVWVAEGPVPGCMP